MVNVRLAVVALSASLVPAFPLVVPAFPIGTGTVASQAAPSRTGDRGTGQQRTGPRRKTSMAPRCETTEGESITIACEYTPTKPGAGHGPHAESRPSPGSSRAPEEAGPVPARVLPVALNRSRLSFKTDDSNDMKVDLTFTKVGAAPIAEAHTIYLAVDDSGGSNYVRRPLPTVDFRGLSAGTPAIFSETLRIAAFPPGRYTISLWIPDSDRARMFNLAYNYLLSSVGVPARATGLNVLAHFTVDR